MLTVTLLSIISLAKCVLGLVEINSGVSLNSPISLEMNPAFFVKTFKYGPTSGSDMKTCVDAPQEQFCYIDKSEPNKLKIFISDISSRYSEIILKDSEGTVEKLSILPTPADKVGVQIKDMKIKATDAKSYIRVVSAEVAEVTGLNVREIPMPANPNCGTGGNTNCIQQTGSTVILSAVDIDDSQNTISCTRGGQQVTFKMSRYVPVDNIKATHVSLSGVVDNKGFRSDGTLSNCKVDAVTQLPKLQLSNFEACADADTAKCYYYEGGGKSQLTIKSPGVSGLAKVHLTGFDAQNIIQATFTPLRCA